MASFQVLGSDYLQRPHAVAVVAEWVTTEAGGTLGNSTAQMAPIPASRALRLMLSCLVMEPPRPRRAVEIEWRRRHPEVLRNFVGEWVALEGDRIVAHGRDLARVVREARGNGIRVPYVFRVDLPRDDEVVMGL